MGFRQRLRPVLVYVCIVSTLTSIIYLWRGKFEGSFSSSRPGLLHISSELFVQYQNQAQRNIFVVDTVPDHQNQNDLTLDDGVQFQTKQATNGSTSSPLTVKPVELSPEARTFLDGSRRVRVALGGGLTSSLGNGSNVIVIYMRMLMPLFRYLLPTFCRTASPGYDYHFYFAYDHNDPLFQPPTSSGDVDGMGEFVRTFDELVTIHCRNVGKPALHMIRCQHQRNPAWAQNDAMMQAYLDGMDFFYRLNDDTTMMSMRWTEQFIAQLNSMSPPLVGVVGPRHSGGNTAILTYDFVHRRHVEIFGFYYPREFTSWWADDWITKVYNKTSRTVKMNRIFIRHVTSLYGNRYRPHFDTVCELETRLDRDFNTLTRYISLLPDAQAASVATVSRQQKRVIAMSLSGDNYALAMGAIRNAQLLPLFFPGWTLRVYLPDNDEESGKGKEVADYYINTLHALGAELVRVRNSYLLPPSVWHFLAADDISADVVLMRSADERLSARDASIVSNWLEGAEGVVHFSNDQPVEKESEFFQNGLWAVKPKALREVGLLKQRFMKDLLLSAFDMESNSSKAAKAANTFLQTFFWPAVKAATVCYSVFPISFKDNNVRVIRAPKTTNSVGEYPLGTKFNAYDIPQNDNVDFLSTEICSRYRQILLEDEENEAKKDPKLANPALRQALLTKDLKITYSDLLTFGVTFNRK